MSAKFKIISLITVLVLALSTLVVGVFAVMKTDFIVSGNIKFKAKGIDSTIKLVGIENDDLNSIGADKFEEFTIRRGEDIPDISSWEDIVVSVSQEAKPLNITIRITNDAVANSDNFLYVETSATNVGNSNFIVRSTCSDNSLVDVIEPQGYADFVISFSVFDKTLDVINKGFTIDFNLQHKQLADFQLNTYYSETLTITPDESTKTATVDAANQNITSAEIPEFVKTANNVICKTKLGSKAFNGCSSIESIYIPKSVSTIVSSGFYNCTSLNSVTLSKSVKELDQLAFQNCSSLTSIEIPDSVTTIETSCFEGSGLTSIIIPESVTSIAKRALRSSSLVEATINANIEELPAIFSPNGSLKKVTLGKHIKSIGTSAFQECTKLETVEINSELTKISDYAFLICEGLKNFNIPDTVTSIGQAAFKSCKALEQIEIPEGVTIINQSTFESCNILNKVVLPKSIKTIDKNAFNSCFKLEDINLGENLTSINDSVFYFCQYLTEISLPQSLKTIGPRAFWNCSYLSSIKIPANVTTIGENAFRGCKRLESITIGSGVSSIGAFALESCNSLETIVIDSSTIAKNMSSESPFADIFLKNDVTLYIKTTIVDAGKVNEYVTETYPTQTAITSENASSLGATDFVGYTRFSVGDTTAYSDTLIFTCNTSSRTASVKAANLEVDNVIIPRYVIESGVQCKVNAIEDYAFSGCSNLTSVSIPSTITSIGSYAFYTCENLQSITIPSGVTAIGDRTFQGCKNLKTANLPDTITSFGNYAFRSCTYLENLTLPSKLKTMGDFALSGCKSLTSLVIPNSVTTIGDYAFEYCFGMTKITIGSGVTSIAEHAFAKTYRLVEVYNLSKVAITSTSFGLDAVDNYDVRIYSSGTSNIKKDTNGFVFNKIDGTYYLIAYEGKETNITLPSSYNGSNYVMRRYALYNYEFLNNVTIPSNLTSIGAYAMAHCYGLTSLVIPSNIQTIGDYAFWKSTAITTITIGSGVTSIGTSAFEGCDSRENIFIDSSSIASQLSGTDLSICGGLLNNFDYLYINNSILSSLNSYVENNYTEEDDLLVTDEHVSGYTYYFTATTVTPAPFEPTDPDPGTSFA